MPYRYPLLILLLTTLLTGVVRAQSDTTPLPTPTLNPILPTPDAANLRIGEWLDGEITNQEASYLVTLEAGRAYRLDADGASTVQITSYGPGTGNVSTRSQFGTPTWALIPYFVPEVSGIYQVTVFNEFNRSSSFRLRLIELNTLMMTPDTSVNGSLTIPGDVSLIPVPNNGTQLLTFRALADIPISLAIYRLPIPGHRTSSIIEPTDYRALSPHSTVELNQVILGADANWLLMVYASNRDQTGSFEVTMTVEQMIPLGNSAMPINVSPEQPVVRMQIYYDMRGVNVLDTGGTAGLEFQFYDYTPSSEPRRDGSPIYPVPALRIISTEALSDRFYLRSTMQLVEIRAVDPNATIQTSIRLFAADPLPLTEMPQEITLSDDYPIERWTFTHDVERPMMIRVEMLGDVYSYGVRAEVDFWLNELTSASSRQGGYEVRQMFIALPIPDSSYGTRFLAILTLIHVDVEMQVNPPTRLRLWLEPLGR